MDYLKGSEVELQPEQANLFSRLAAGMAEYRGCSVLSREMTREFNSKNLL